MKKPITTIIAIVITIAITLGLALADESWQCLLQEKIIFYGIFSCNLNFCWWAVVNKDDD